METIYMNIRELHKNISKIPQLIQGDTRIIVTKRDTQLFQIGKIEKQDEKLSPMCMDDLLKYINKDANGPTNASQTVDSIYL